MTEINDENTIEEILLPESVEVSPEPETIEVLPKPKAKPKARGMRGPDKKPRAKPAITHTRQRETIVKQQESPESSSADEATMSELHSLQLLRSIRAHDNNRNTRKQMLYSSWFR